MKRFIYKLDDGMAMEDLGKKSQAWEAGWYYQIGGQKGRKISKMPQLPHSKSTVAFFRWETLSRSKNRER